MLTAAGLSHPGELGPEHVIRRISRHEVRSFSTLFDFVAPNELLEGGASRHAVFCDYWEQADPDSFDPPLNVWQLRQSKLV